MHPNKLKSMYFALISALVFFLMPWPSEVLVFRPDFVLLTLIFWLVRAPNLCNIGTAWLLGLCVDLATGSMFGQHALTYTITSFFAVFYQRRLVLFSGSQQLFYVFNLLMIAQLVLLMLKIFAGETFIGWQYFIPSIVGVLVWKIALLLGINTGARDS